MSLVSSITLMFSDYYEELVADVESGFTDHLNHTPRTFVKVDSSRTNTTKPFENDLWICGANYLHYDTFVNWVCGLARKHGVEIGVLVETNGRFVEPFIARPKTK